LDALETFEILKACKEGKDLSNDQTFLSPSPMKKSSEPLL
jgi:hypothetical protein